ncbi:MAG: hypothetical protein K6A69_02255, partial [Lachnospiraceae bacterium]|nr:hypothetical protein [Lachnospiraceae bacterium]
MFLKNLFRRNRDEEEYYDEYEEYDEYEDGEYDEDGDEILDLNEIDEAEEYDDEYEDEYDDEEYEAEEYEDEYDEEYDEYEEDYDEDLEILDLNEDEEYYEEERGFGKIIGTIGRWSTQQKVVAAATAVTVLAAAAIGGVAAFTALRPAEEVAVETPAAIEETPAEVVAAAPKDSMVIPEFKEVNVTGDSIEKDLTLYFTDDKDEKITGEEFAVKLVKPGSTESLAEAQETLETDEKYLEALDSAAISGLFYTPELQKSFEEIMDKNGNDADKAKSELKQLVAKFTVDESELNADPAEKEEPADEEKSDEKTEEKAEEKESVSLFDGIKKLFAAGTVKAEETTGSVANKTNESLVGIINAATGHAITIKDYYLLKKQDDMAVYGKAVQDLKGTEYKDDDKDGMIYIKSIDSGDYTVCMVPHSG